MGELGAIVFGFLLIAAFVGVSIVMPIVAYVSARRARRELALLQIEMRDLRRIAMGIPPAFPTRPAPQPVPIVVAETPPAAVIETPAPEPMVEPLPETPISPSLTPPIDAPPPESMVEPIEIAPPPPPIADVAPPPAASAEGTSLEEQIALVWFTRIGAAVLLLGVAWFFKYAVDNNWIGPLGRVAIGALAGAVILVTAEALRPRTRAVYIQVLAGVGLALLYVSAYSSHAFYHLIPAPAAFGAVAVITLLGGALAIHHNGEAILVLALLAGFSSPVLLSTGEDRPAALFGYLFVLTSLAFYASLRMRFRWATWLSIVGPPILFAGWYQRFYDVSPPIVEVREAGAYFTLASRAAPLIAVALFFAQWVAVYVDARRRELRTLLPLWILCAAALASHAGFAALLYDRPLILGAVLAALALASSLLFGREDRRELLLLPLGAAFFVLVATLHGSRSPDAIGVMAVLALWGAVYARAFLQGQLGEGRAPSPLMLWSVGAVGIAVAVAAAVLLIEPHPRSFAIAMAVLSLLYAALAVATVRPIIGVAAAVLTLGAIGLADQELAIDPRFILVAAAWSSVYLASIAWDVLRRNAPATAMRLVTFSVAGLGFALLGESQTRDQQWLLRAGILAAVGVVDLAFGAALLANKRGDGAASLVLGQALALFAGAFAYVFSGATLTLVWAAMGAVVAVLAAEREDGAWLAGAAALFCVALIHLVAIDARFEETQRLLFEETNGKRGLMRLPLVLNERAYALAGTAIALLVAARAASRRATRLFTTGGAILLAVGHTLILALLVSETHNAVLHTPAPAPNMDQDELTQFMQAFDDALAAAEQQLRMMTTLVMGAYAALLVGIGFGLRERMHRYLGLSLFAFTLLKLSLYDIWKLPRVYQMLVFLSVGALLLGAGYLYARFGKRLLRVLRDGSADTVKAAIVIFALLGASRANAFDKAALMYSRPIDGVSAPGLYRVEVDPALYRHVKSDALDDVRIAAPDGSEVAWLLRRVPPPAQAVEHAVTLVDPVTLPDGSTRATLDLGAPGLKHSEVQLKLDGDGDFFRKTRIESSNDEQSWALLTEGAYVFRVNTGSEQTTLRYPLSDARYLRVTLLPAAGSAVRISGASTAFNPPEARVPLRRLESVTPLPPDDAAAAPVKGETRLLFDLGAAGVPIAALELDVGNGQFERHALLASATQKAYWVPVGSTLLYRVPTGSRREENLSLPGGATRKRFLRVTITNGDDAPLEVRAAHPEYIAEELVFRAPAAGKYTLYAGGELAAPAYDLAAVLARSNEQPTATATFGAIADNDAHANAPLPPPPLSERYRVPIGIALSLLLAGLALWTLKLLRRSRGDA